MSHIVKHINEEQTEEQARRGIDLALTELENGTDFATVAEMFSDCKENRGDLGEFHAGTMVPEFEDAIRDLEPGQRTGVFRTGFGFHVAELRSKTPAGFLTLEEVQEDIYRVLTKISEHREYSRMIAVLRDQANIEFVPDAARNETAAPYAADSTRVR